MFGDIYQNKRVLITGHTGFKGSWLACWLRELGAEVCGIALPMKTAHSHFDLLHPDIRSEMTDICNRKGVRRVFAEFQPEAVFHLAAQPLVRVSYREPDDTFAVNVMGTVNVLEACRSTPSVRAIVVISSDKCYENREWLWGYRESEPMGGYDPYSASKGCAELVVASWRRSFFHNEDYGKKHHILLASGRAGNVIGGGDWAEDRLVPDLIKAAATGKRAEIRNPEAVRPWQHVLEPLSGYLQLGQKLLEGEARFADGWNFGPAEEGIISVKEAAAALRRHWGAIQIDIRSPESAPHEAELLRLDCSKARHSLGWYGTWSPEEAFLHTAQWYRSFYEEKKVRTKDDLRDYIASARSRGLAWTK